MFSPRNGPPSAGARSGPYDDEAFAKEVSECKEGSIMNNELRYWPVAITLGVFSAVAFAIFAAWDAAFPPWAVGIVDRPVHG